MERGEACGGWIGACGWLMVFGGVLVVDAWRIWLLGTIVLGVAAEPK